jgi:hypothetical protein
MDRQRLAQSPAHAALSLVQALTPAPLLYPFALSLSKGCMCSLS